MAMTVHCAMCGHENDLGRVFCSACGQRLRFDGLDAVSFNRQPRLFRWGRLFRIGMLILLLLSIALGLLALSGRLGEPARQWFAARVSPLLRLDRAP